METRETKSLILYNNGTIRSKKTKRLLTMTPGKNNYIFICWTYEDGRRGRRSVHRIIAEAFIPNPLGLPHINHINLNRQDNRVENLEWCTAKHNIGHSIKLGGINPKGQFNANAKLTEEQALAIKYNHPHLNGVEVAAIYGCTRHLVNNIRSGRTWKHI
jgi:hypothetical protein